MKTKPNQTLKVKIEEILMYQSTIDNQVRMILALFESVIPKKRRKVDYPKGIKGDAWHYGWDDGYNSALKDIRQKIGESK